MDTCFILILIVGTGLVTGDNIDPEKETEKNTKETETVKMSCSYSTSSEYVWLYWYRQYPNKEPQYLLYKGARSRSSNRHTSDHRFQSTTSRSSTELTITDVRLSDSALYYCALRVGFYLTGAGVDPLTFGAPIRLTVEPKDAKPTPPALSIFSSVDGEGQDICLAAGFFPQVKTMTLTPEGKELKTDDAPLFTSSKTYYYAGFNGGKIQKCEMDNKTATPPSDNSVPGNPTTPTPLNPTKNGNSAPVIEIIKRDDPKMNSMTLLVTGLRILLAKCVAVNVLMTVKAFLF